MPPLTRILYAAAAFFVALGIALFFILSRVDGRAAAADTTPGATQTGQGTTAAAQPGDSRPLESFALVVDSNMFSPGRSAPRVRFTIRPATADSVPAAPRAPSAPALRVYGITLRSTDSTALIDADPRVPGAEMYRVGATLPNGSLIVEMTDSFVVVEGPRGRQVLRLETKSRP
jgi:hypothetical protein